MHKNTEEIDKMLGLHVVLEDSTVNLNLKLEQWIPGTDPGIYRVYDPG